MDKALPADLNQRLDALLDEADSADQATADQTDLAVQTDLDDTAEEGDDESDESPDAAASESDEDDDESADSESDSDEEDDESDEDDDEWAGVPPAVRATIEQQNALLAQYAAQEEERRIAAANAQAEQQYADWLKRLDEMDPEDRNAEIAKVLADGYGSLLRQTVQREQARRDQETFTQQHSASLEFVAQGHRVEPTGRRLADGRPEYRRVDGASLPLTEREKRVVAKVTGGPLAMQEAANELVEMRRGQTAAARRALAQKRRAENEGPTLTPGRQGSGPRQADRPDYSQVRTLNDKLDLLLDHQDQQYGGPLAGGARR